MTEKILVTGGTGVIGAWVVRELIESGVRPVVLTRGMTNVGRVIVGELSDQADWVTADIEEPWSLMATFREFRPTSVIHMASVKPWQVDAGFVGRPDPPAAVRNIIEGTTNLLEASRQFGVRRFVYASSKAVYAPFSSVNFQIPVVDTSYPTLPDTFYGVGKLGAEHLGRLYRERFGLEFVAIRFASAYGPFKRGPAHLPSGILSHALGNKPIEVRITAHEYRDVADDFIHNRDVARAFVRASVVVDPSISVFNVGSGTAVTVEEIVSTVRRINPRSALTVRIDDSAESVFPGTVGAHAGILDSSSAHQHLGWEPMLDLEAGLIETAAFNAMSNVDLELRR